MPPRERFTYTFDNLAHVVNRFADLVTPGRLALYVFDYGAPIGFRIAAATPTGCPRSSHRTAMRTTRD
jgi:hypothetical protein